MPAPKVWRSRLRTLRAAALLFWAQLLVATVPFHRWRGSLGPAGKLRTAACSIEVRQTAGHVERAAALIPFHIKCLPRAITLSWLLRRKGIGHMVVIAVRPGSRRQAEDDLHAWLEVDGRRIIGDLPGPWIEILRLGDCSKPVATSAAVRH